MTAIVKAARCRIVCALLVDDDVRCAAGCCTQIVPFDVPICQLASVRRAIVDVGDHWQRRCSGNTVETRGGGLGDRHVALWRQHLVAPSRVRVQSTSSEAQS